MASEMQDLRAFGPRPVIVGGGDVRVRPARPTDEPLLVGLIERSSAETVRRRFHGVFGSAARRELTRIAQPTHVHRSWVAVADGQVVGTITLARDRQGRFEVAIIVEDAWAGRGVGRRLMEAVLRDAQRQGVQELVAWVQPENLRAIAFFRTVVPGAIGAFVDGDVVMRVPVPAVVRPLRSRAAAASVVRADGAADGSPGRAVSAAAGAPPAIASRVRTA